MNEGPGIALFTCVLPLLFHNYACSSGLPVKLRLSMMVQ